MCSPSGSCCRIARNAVGAVKSVATPCSRDHAPERARVGRADRLPLVEHRRAAVQERRVDDVRVADDPADVRRRPVHLARLDVVDVLHRPRERDRVAAVVAHDPLRLAGRPRRVEDVERVGRLDGTQSAGLGVAPPRRSSRGRARRRAPPRASAAGGRCSARASTRRGRSPRRAAACTRRCAPARSRTTRTRRPSAARPRSGSRARSRRSRRRRPSARRRAARRRASRSTASGHHRHVDDDPVAALDALRGERAGEARHRVAQLAVGERRRRLRDRRVVDQRELVAAAAVDVPVERVVAGVEPAAA